MAGVKADIVTISCDNLEEFLIKCLEKIQYGSYKLLDAKDNGVSTQYNQTSHYVARFVRQSPEPSSTYYRD